MLLHWSEKIVLGLPGIDRVEQVTWVMTKIVSQLQGKIVEIGIDVTCENPSDHQNKALAKKTTDNTNFRHLEL